MVTVTTVEDFSDTTVMRVIRKIVNYICNDLVDGINNNDIVSGQFSVQGNQLSGTLTKGDGTTIDIPAATLPSGGGGSDNPYPTAVSMTLSGTTLNFSMTMSSGSPITGSVNLAPILKLSTDGNNITLNGNSVAIVKTVSGQVTDGNLKITINGVESGDIPLPEGGILYQIFLSIPGRYFASGNDVSKLFNESKEFYKDSGQPPGGQYAYISGNKIGLKYSTWPDDGTQSTDTSPLTIYKLVNDIDIKDNVVLDQSID